MNENIELLVDNCFVFCDRLRISEEIPFEKMFENKKILETVKFLYDQNEQAKSKIKINELIDKLKPKFKKPKLPQTLAQSENLEKWLDSSRRVNNEKRFEAYLRFLQDSGKGSICHQLDADTFKILDYCHNPNEINNEWDRRGLVYGHVQSGKTANYIGLINRAFDAGYQVVIVLTGMTNDLRSQTQRRIDEGIVGERGRNKIGIGKDLVFQNIEEKIRQTTTINDDLSSKSAALMCSVISTNDKSIWVLKKNKKVLENLISWLDSQRIDSNGFKSEKIYNTPFLIIDDEADNASIKSLSKKDYEEWEIGLELSDLDNLTEEEEKKLENAINSEIKAINRNIRWHSINGSQDFYWLYCNTIFDNKST